MIKTNQNILQGLLSIESDAEHHNGTPKELYLRAKHLISRSKNPDVHEDLQDALDDNLILAKDYDNTNGLIKNHVYRMSDDGWTDDDDDDLADDLDELYESAEDILE